MGDQKRVRKMLGHDLDWWNAAMLISLGLAAIAAISVVVTTRAVIVLQSQEAQDSAAAFERYRLDTEAKIADANEKAEAERLARVRIEERIAPRGLTEEQQQRITKQLEKFGGQKFSAMVAATADSVPLWTAIDQSLRAAGWLRMAPKGLAVGNPPAGVPINPLPGVGIGVSPDHMQDVGPIAEALWRALNGEGIAADWYPENGPMVAAPDAILLTIGVKP